MAGASLLAEVTGNLAERKRPGIGEDVDVVRPAGSTLQEYARGAQLAVMREARHDLLGVGGRIVAQQLATAAAVIGTALPIDRDVAAGTVIDELGRAEDGGRASDVVGEEPLALRPWIFLTDRVIGFAAQQIARLPHLGRRGARLRHQHAQADELLRGGDEVLQMLGDRHKLGGCSARRFATMCPTPVVAAPTGPAHRMSAAIATQLAFLVILSLAPFDGG